MSSFNPFRTFAQKGLKFISEILSMKYQAYAPYSYFRPVTNPKSF